MNDEELENLRKFEENRQQLISLYRKHNPDLLGTVDDTLKQWSGREKELLLNLTVKYEGKDYLAKQLREDYNNTVETLKVSYREKIRPAEEAFRFDLFYSPFLENADFEAKPMILLLGQYSVGKTTFIRHLLERDFPNMRIGPEPTTDRFTAIQYGTDDQVIPGNALTADSNSPFRALEKYGTNFLNRLESVKCKAKMLESITFIDTPGVLSGEKQRIGRNYDFPGVVEWLAERSDRILLLFDAHKLDISDEFKRVIEACKGHDDKMRVILNKSDSISPQQLLRVYGALMWSLGKVLKSPEVTRVYVGSFNDQPINPLHENYSLFEAEKADLMKDLLSLPRNSSIRKVNETLKRARLAKLHMTIMTSLRNEMPIFYGKAAKQQELLSDLPNQFQKMSMQFRIPLTDFPNPERMRAVLETLDLSKFPSTMEKYGKKLEQFLTEDIQGLMKRMKHPETTLVDDESSSMSNPFFIGNSNNNLDSNSNWIVPASRKLEYDLLFKKQLLSNNSKLQGNNAREFLQSFQISDKVLFKIWNLCDIDQDGCLDSDEFALTLHLIEEYKSGVVLPEILPPSYVPPSKR